MTRTEVFLSTYGSYTGVCEEELLWLMRYERALRCALRVIPGERNKQLLLAIGAHLEGSNRTYVTGGAATTMTRRRIKIYEQLAHIQPKPRLNKKQKVARDCKIEPVDDFL
jgi:hypothetical protein